MPSRRKNDKDVEMLCKCPKKEINTNKAAAGKRQNGTATDVPKTTSLYEPNCHFNGDTAKKEPEAPPENRGRRFAPFNVSNPFNREAPHNALNEAPNGFQQRRDNAPHDNITNGDIPSANAMRKVKLKRRSAVFNASNPSDRTNDEANESPSGVLNASIPDGGNQTDERRSAAFRVTDMFNRKDSGLQIKRSFQYRKNHIPKDNNESSDATEKRRKRDEQISTSSNSSQVVVKDIQPELDLNPQIQRVAASNVTEELPPQPVYRVNNEPLERTQNVTNEQEPGESTTQINVPAELSNDTSTNITETVQPVTLEDEIICAQNVVSANGTIQALCRSNYYSTKYRKDKTRSTTIGPHWSSVSTSIGPYPHRSTRRHTKAAIVTDYDMKSTKIHDSYEIDTLMR